ncbi:MAG: DNA repair protein RadC [Fimbriimonadaceae bacterium]|nr:DNA repair protein RadC [Chitinophagales bacterium]
MSENITIKHLAEEDRPREKLLLKGRHALTNAELIAILIGSGNIEETAVELSQKILANYNNDLNILGKLTVNDLQKFKGIGEAKAISIIAALELGRRRQLSEAETKKQIKNSRDIFETIEPLISDLQHEEFWILHLNKANKIIEKERISAGGVTGTVVDVKMILKSAVEKLASSIAVCHNHPSGNLNPSEADIQLTRKIKEGGKNLDIILIDHIIVGDKNYYSFSDNGII